MAIHLCATIYKILVYDFDIKIGCVVGQYIIKAPVRPSTASKTVGNCNGHKTDYSRYPHQVPVRVGNCVPETSS